jgi:hypothetical protein
MSAFICSDDTINRILDGIATHQDRVRDFIGYALQAGFKDNQEVANALRKLNTRAVNQRYRERTKFIAPKVNDQRTAITKMQFYKSLSCLLYQCGEGDVPSKRLYKELMDMRHRLAHDLLTATPAWDACSWD